MSTEDMQSEQHASADTAMDAPMAMAPSQKNNAQRTFLFGILGAVVVLVLVGYGVTTSAVKKGSQHPAIVQAASIFGTPAVVVNGDRVLYTDYIHDLRALTQFYTAQNIPIDATQISDQVLVRLTANTILAKVADDFGIEVSEEDIAPQRAQVLAEFASEEDAKAQIEALYGWTFDEFVDNIVVPLTLEQKLEEAFSDPNRTIEGVQMVEEVQASHILFQANEGESDAALKARAQKVLDRIKKGEDFATLAKEFGTDGTKEVGGDLGYFGRGVMVPAFEEAVFALEAGKLSEELVKTDFGYHIVKVMDKRMSRDFASFVNETLAKATIELKIDVHNPFVLDQAPAIAPEAMEQAQ